MKKGVLFSVLGLFAVLFITGCGDGNKLICKMDQTVATGQGDGYNYEMAAKVSMGVDGDENITSLDMTIDVTLQDKLYEAVKQQGDLDENMKTLTSQFEAGISSQQGLAEAIKSKSSSYKNNVITLNVEMDMSKATQNKTKKEAIEYFEAQGYKCDK